MGTSYQKYYRTFSVRGVYRWASPASGEEVLEIHDSASVKEGGM